MTDLAFSQVVSDENCCVLSTCQMHSYYDLYCKEYNPPVKPACMFQKKASGVFTPEGYDFVQNKLQFLLDFVRWVDDRLQQDYENHKQNNGTTCIRRHLANAEYVCTRLVECL